MSSRYAGFIRKKYPCTLHHYYFYISTPSFASTIIFIYPQDWGRSLQDSQNLCSFFIPSLLDDSLCPKGKHVIHVYSSGGEPYEPWEKLKPGTAEYEAYKEERAQVLFQAVQRAIPDIMDRLEFKIIGSPLAHEAFLRRDRLVIYVLF